MVIFPAIDIRDGRCVRLVQGDYARETVYHDDPLGPALEFAAAGAEWLHVVDLDGAKLGAPANTDAIRRIVREAGLPVQVGGGIRSVADARTLLELGVERVIVGTRLANDAALAREFFEALGGRVVAGIDAKDGFVAVHGWTATTGLEAVRFAQDLQTLGAKRVVFTDIAVDGSLAGPSLERTRTMAEALDIPVIASGGVGCVDDLRALAALPIEGAIVGKALYEGRFALRSAIEIATLVRNPRPSSVQ